MGDSQESIETPEGEGKIQRSVDSSLRQIYVTEEERKYREENFDNVDVMKDHEKYLVCTRCDSDFQRTIKKGEIVMVHPLLGVLMCDSCCDYFGDGNFSMDSEGEDKYCRWCGDGGTIFVCFKCNFGFCDACIKKHFGESGLEEVKKNDNWTCYFCNPKPLWFLRSLCFLAEEAAKNKRLLLRKKEGRRLKKKRRKKGSDESDTYGRSSDEGSSSSSLKHIKLRRSLRKVEKIAADDSSSSAEDELQLENHTNLKKKRGRSRRRPSKEEKKEQSSETNTRTRKKRMNITPDNTDDSENKKSLLLEKLKSIWKLTESVLEAGLTSSQEKMKHLSKNWKFKTLESLKREHEDLKSCIGVLATSINSASNSVNAIKDDLTFNTAKNESEIIRRQEMKLKRFAKKFQKQSHDETSADSDGNTSQNELQEKERSTRNVEKKEEETGVRSGEGSEGREEKERGKNVSEGEGNVGDADDDGARDDECDSGKESSPVKPLLKVKSFARMLNDNVYDNDKNSCAVDVYDVETDDSENEKQMNKGNKREASKDSEKEPSKESGKKKISDEAKEKSRDSMEDEEIMDKSKNESGQEKESSKNNENFGKREEKIKKKKETSEIENEKSEESGKNPNQEENNSSDENENAKETVSGGEEKPDSESGYENEREKEKKKEKKNSSHESEKSSEEEERCTRRTRNLIKGKKELKASFEKFKRKRERYLRSTKESKSDKDKVKKMKVLESSESEIDAEKKEKMKSRRPKKWVLVSSDEENSEKEKQTKSSDEDGKGDDEKSSDEMKTSKNSEEESEKENQNGKSDAVITSGTTSEEEFNTRKRKRIRRRKKGNTDSEEDPGKKKRRKTKVGSSDSSEDEENEKNKGGRKNIRKILKKDLLQDETKEALKTEEERKKRLKEKQKLFEELFSEAQDLILDFDPETKEPLVTVHKKLARKLKPHQVSGVKFMWDNCFESVKKLEEDNGSGCILAHCMGLGKTLQVITLVHTVMTHDLGVQSVLIVCPLSTVSNWIREFEIWLENIHTEPITLYDLTNYKKTEERRMHLEDWHKNGGVLVLSYDLFRNLTKTLIEQHKSKKKKSKRLQKLFEKILLDPGPDLVVCDEGHVLKNVDTTLSKCVSRLKTARRIVLTGTPLQNNLIEYHCMVQFVKPNILGTRKEFCNRFVNPINNGQFEDSTELDVRIMKRRSHVLHSMLEGCIQRFDYSVLTPFLPEKHEYVLQIALTDTQAKSYLHFIKNLSFKSFGCMKASSLFTDYHNLHRIWTHPRMLLMWHQRQEDEEPDSDSRGSIKDFIVSSDEETDEPGSYSTDDSKPETIESSKGTPKSNPNDPEVRKKIEEEENQKNNKWWEEFYEKKSYNDLRESNKLVLLFDLLKYCGEVKDKVLVFSQSLNSLDLIEYFLAEVHNNNKKDDEKLCGHSGTWILGSDYFRLDGTTSSETRKVWCKTFNKETNTRGRLFLISTKAGGLGINLHGANRVVVFDASWNPSHDVQSIFRVYRFGQKKPCYVYRFLSEATMEEKIYERQVTKLSLAHRVVDEHQIERHYTMGDLQELYRFEPTSKDQRKVPKLPKDTVLAELLANHKDEIVGYHEHDSLLENKQEEELSEEERKAAWKEYEEEKVQRTYQLDAELLLQQMQQQQQGEGTTRFINPAHIGLTVNPNYMNPIYLRPNIPIDALERGLHVGMVPLPQESLDAFMKRLISREAFLNAEVVE